MARSIGLPDANSSTRAENSTDAKPEKPAPVWHGGTRHEAELLRSCYENSLKLAAENGCRSIAFSCISTGVYGYPHEAAAGIAVETVRAWNGDLPEEVIFCCFSNEMLKIYESKGVPVISVSHHSA